MRKLVFKYFLVVFMTLGFALISNESTNLGIVQNNASVSTTQINNPDVMPASPASCFENNLDKINGSTQLSSSNNIFSPTIDFYPEPLNALCENYPTTTIRLASVLKI